MNNLIAKVGSFDAVKHIRLIGIIAILLCIITQAMEFSGLAVACVFCRSMRACIGLLGLICVLPYCPILSRLCTMVIAFFGAHVASAAIFINIEQKTFINEFFILSVLALCIIAAQVLIIMTYQWRKTGSDYSA